VRPWIALDAPAVFAACQDPEIGRWTNVPQPYLREHADVAKKIEAKLLAHHGVKREVGPPALSTGLATGGPAGTVRPMVPQPKAQVPDKRR